MTINEQELAAGVAIAVVDVEKITDAASLASWLKQERDEMGAPEGQIKSALAVMAAMRQRQEQQGIVDVLVAELGTPFVRTLSGFKKA